MERILKGKMSTNVERFFCGLYERMWKENDLSDITHALCVSNVEFRQFFLNFFFREERLCATEVDISREWCDGNGNRPDFCIRDCDGHYYFVEVKLWDGNLHFASYRDGLKNLNNCDDNEAVKYIAYIAAYEIDKKSLLGCNSLHTWYEFYNEVKSFSFLNDDTIKGYSAFVYAVAGLQSKEQTSADIMNYTTFNESEFCQVVQFMNTIDDTIEKAEDVVAYTRSSRWFKRGCRMGKFFEVKNFKDDHSVWGWVGAFYDTGDPQICVWFEDRPGWGRLVCDKFKDKCRGNKPIYDAWYYDGESGNLYFYMLDFDDDISTFFNRVLNKIKSIDPKSCKLENEKVKEKFKSLLSMRRFPLWMERKFLNEVQKDDYVVMLDASGDSEDPYNHCGRYFTVEKRQKDCQGKKLLIKGWAGVLFGKNENAIDKPRVEIQFLKENGRYECEQRLGDLNPVMDSIASEFRKVLTEHCKCFVEEK